MDRPAILLEGNDITLRFIKETDDFLAYERWVNDQETTRYMAIGRFPLTVKLLKEYVASYNASQNFLLGIYLKDNHAHVGNITLHMIDRQNAHAEIGILIGEKDCRGKGIGYQALMLIVDHAFNRLNLNKVAAGVIEGNEASRRLFLKGGFTLEGTLREHFYLDGKHWACWRYGLLRREYVPREIK